MQRIRGAGADNAEPPAEWERPLSKKIFPSPATGEKGIKGFAALDSWALERSSLAEHAVTGVCSWWISKPPRRQQGALETHCELCENDVTLAVAITAG